MSSFAKFAYNWLSGSKAEDTTNSETTSDCEDPCEQLDEMGPKGKNDDKGKKKYGKKNGQERFPEPPEERGESMAEFFAREERAQKERDAERKRKADEEQSKWDEERKQKDDQRNIDERNRRINEEKEQAERQKDEQERDRIFKEDMERLARLKAEETERRHEVAQLEIEFERRKAREESEHHDQFRRMKENSERERNERERLAMERADEAIRLSNLQQLQYNKEIASSSLTSIVASATSDMDTMRQRMARELATENESQKSLNKQAEQLQKELERSALEQKINTSMFVKVVDDSIHASLAESDKKNKLELEESRISEKMREESRLQYENESKTKKKKEEEEIREKEKAYQEYCDRKNAEKEIRDNIHNNEMYKQKETHEARVEELLADERRKMEEMNRKQKDREEERRTNWRRMMQGFAEMMRARFTGMMSNETEKRWDDRFNELRRSYDPVKDAFYELGSIPLRKSEIEASLIRFEAHLESLRMSLTTLKEIMSSELNQVDTWKQQQTGAYFLADLGSSLASILRCIAEVRREIKLVADGIGRNRKNIDGLEVVFKLHYLEERMKELRNAVNSIPNVYDLKNKYGNGYAQTDTII